MLRFSSVLLKIAPLILFHFLHKWISINTIPDGNKSLSKYGILPLFI